MKKNGRAEVTESKPKFISMILRLTTAQHSWIKEVADATEQTQPHVINYVLDQIIKSPASDYIEELGKIRKAELREELLAKQQELKEQLHKLEQDLN